MDRSAVIGSRADTLPATRFATRALLASGILGGISLLFLIGMFVAFGLGAQSPGMALGWVNDMLGWITCLLALPSVLAIHRLLRPSAPVASLALAVVGTGGFSAIVVLQLLLVTRVLTFEQQIGPVSVAYLVLGVWLVGSGALGSRAGVIPHGARWGLFAALYVGYPFWAIRTARILERSGSDG